MINLDKIFCKSCLAFCETSSLVKISRIAFKNSEKIAISCLTAVSLDVQTIEVPCNSAFSSIDRYL